MIVAICNQRTFEKFQSRFTCPSEKVEKFFAQSTAELASYGAQGSTKQKDVGLCTSVRSWGELRRTRTGNRL